MIFKFIFLLILLTSCENIFYDSYKIIDLNKQIQKDSQLYTVKKGDNLYSISRKFNVSIEKMIRKNNISPPFKIFPKQKIIIPKKRIHVVKKGDTLYSISRNYKTDLFSISNINNIGNINTIKVGQKLFIPSSDKKLTNNKKRKNVVDKKSYKIKKSSKKRTIISTNNSFIWPVKGKIVLGFGKTNPGFYNDGINIKSSHGSNVKASQDGEVIYSGNEIPGYGNLVLIKHSKNWITAYAHLDKIYKKKGSLVKKGDYIGLVGKSGNVNEPQLHFEIRKGKEAVNPMHFLS